MGAWGEKPWDNDTAADFCYHIDSIPITKLIGQGLASNTEDEQRIAAWLLSSVGQHYVYPCELKDQQCKLALQRLEAMRNGDWIAGWNNQQRVHKLLGEEIEAIKAIT